MEERTRSTCLTYFMAFIAALGTTVMLADIAGVITVRHKTAVIYCGPIDGGVQYRTDGDR